MNPFDTIVIRKNTKSEKWDNVQNIFGNKDVLPMWVADTDFKVASPIVTAIQERAQHPIYGYTILTDEFYQSIIDFVRRHHQWEIKKEWIHITPGVMCGVGLALNAWTEKGDGIIIQTPVYTPFFKVINSGDRKILRNPLKKENGKFLIDFDNLEERMKEGKVLLLCSPHNPTGRVFTEEELGRIAALAEKHHIKVISDEIHSDIIHTGHKHYPIADQSDYVKENSLTMIAPSKTYNLPGLTTSVAIIPNEDLRKQFEKTMYAMGFHEGNVFGVEALEVAYKDCDPWLMNSRNYLDENQQLVLNYIKEHLPKLQCAPSEGTFLMWIDFSAYGTPEEVSEKLVFKGEVALSDGRIYGDEGTGYFRLNIGCPRDILLEGLERISKALN